MRTAPTGALRQAMCTFLMTITVVIGHADVVFAAPIPELHDDETRKPDDEEGESGETEAGADEESPSEGEAGDSGGTTEDVGAPASEPEAGATDEGPPTDEAPSTDAGATEAPAEEAPSVEGATPETPAPAPATGGVRFVSEDADTGEVDVPAEPAPAEATTETPAERTAPIVSEGIRPTRGLEPGADRETGIRGRIVDSESGAGLEQAPVMVRGGGRTRFALTGGNGRYRLFLAPGEYSVRSYYDYYHGARLDGVRVERGAFANVNLLLDPIDEEDVGVEEQEIAYRADTASEQAQLNLRREAVNVQDAVSAEEISRSGDSSASSAARRVVGVTIDDDNQLIVRGLGGRYSRVLLNGVAVPSTDPDIPGVQLDIFPTDIVSNLAVTKTTRPDLPADFAGGVLAIDTNNFPREFQLGAGVSLGFNTSTSFQDRPDYRGGSLDWLGFDDGTRALPSSIPNEVVRITPTGSFQSFEDLEAAGESFENAWEFQRNRALPNMGIDFSVADTVRLRGPRSVGYSIALLYNNDTQRQESGIARRLFNFDSEGNAEIENDFRVEEGQNEVLWGTFGSAVLNLNDDHELTAVMLFSRTMSDTTLDQVGFTNDVGGDIRKISYDFVGRSVFFNQLRGDHRNLGKTRVRLRWNGFVGTGRREQPDRRQVRYNEQTDELISNNNSGSRFFSDLEQLDVGFGTNLHIPLWQQAYGTVGGRVRVTDRELNNRRFVLRRIPGSDFDFTLPPEVIFGPDGIGDAVRIDEVTSNVDGYDATGRLYAAFAMLETPVVGKLKFLGGVRFELFEQRIESSSPFDNAPPPDPETGVTDRTDVDVLPSASFSYGLGSNMYLRAAYGMSVARPAIRELAPYVFTDFLRERNIQGNADLKRTRIQNADLRWEWYFGDTELLAASVFYKHFRDPIELVVFSPTNFTVGYANADDGRLIGGEIELRISFQRLHESLRYFSLSGNLALTTSRVRIPAERAQTSDRERRLFNQSPYVTNLSLRFDHPDSGVSASLVYNVAGPAIVEAGATVGEVVIPSLVKQPFHSLDLVASWNVNEHFKLKFKFKNMLFDTRDQRRGEFLIVRERPAATVSIGAEYAY